MANSRHVCDLRFLNLSFEILGLRFNVLLPPPPPHPFLPSLKFEILSFRIEVLDIWMVGQNIEYQITNINFFFFVLSNTLLQEQCNGF